MTMPSITARERHAHRVNGKFAKRPEAYVQHLNDDAWPDSAMQEAARINRVQSVEMPTPPEPWSEPVERLDWLNWHDIAIGALVAIVGGVFVAGASLALTGAVFGFDPVQVAADIRGAL